MVYYVVLDVAIHDLPTYQQYMARVKPMIEAVGGRYLVRGGEHRVLEGDWAPTRLVLLEFPSSAVVEALFSSPDYLAIKSLRVAASRCDLVGVEGVAG